MGYKGTLCTDCVDGYFSSLKNETHSICTACDESCKTCTGPTNRDCNQCEGGWVLEGDACIDVDECAAETPPCEENQFCKNINGSYYCEECDSTCVGCTGKGPEHCKECIPGYTHKNGQCTDIDECSLEEKACIRKDENCYNTPGSFVCVCPDGFEETDDACIKTQVQGDGEWAVLLHTHGDALTDCPPSGAVWGNLRVTVDRWKFWHRKQTGILEDKQIRLGRRPWECSLHKKMDSQQS